MIVLDLTQKPDLKPKYKYEFTHVLSGARWEKVEISDEDEDSETWEYGILSMMKISENIVAVRFSNELKNLVKGSRSVVIYKGKLTIK